MPIIVNKVIENWELKLNKKMNMIRMHSHQVQSSHGHSINYFNTANLQYKKRMYSKQYSGRNRNNSLEKVKTQSKGKNIASVHQDDLSNLLSDNMSKGKANVNNTSYNQNK